MFRPVIPGGIPGGTACQSPIGSPNGHPKAGTPVTATVDLSSCGSTLVVAKSQNQSETVTRGETWALVMAGMCLADGRGWIAPKVTHSTKKSLALASLEMSKLEGWFRKFIREDERGCWIWHGARFRGGYGAVGWQGTSRCAHRVIWELMVGDLPRNLDLDHLCRVRACVNPEHLEPVTRSMNLMRGAHPTQGRLGRARAA